MNKFVWIVPACITGGPLMMSDMAGIYSHRSFIVLPGVVLVTIGLGIMFDIVFKQYAMIKTMQEELRIVKESHQN
jgi:hypothetical protein